ncbi:hypothetical protein LJB83_02165 [Clostridia bacterium OttesenSCG-928-F22]|nr:hypothetical protein [Clostridia bacterium OttesenSCG-928-F22]
MDSEGTLPQKSFKHGCLVIPVQLVIYPVTMAGTGAFPIQQEQWYRFIISRL